VELVLCATELVTSSLLLRGVVKVRLPLLLPEAVGLERGPLNLASTIEELPGRKSSGPGPENREHSRRDPSC
jgi:hypothetical protein